MAARGGRRIHVGPVTVQRAGGGVRTRFTATSVGADVWTETVGLHCAGPGVDAVEPLGEVALATFLLPAMRRGARLEIAAPTSRRLLHEVPQIQRLYSQWESSHRVIDVVAPASDDGKRGDGVGLFFSAGVDSFHTLLTTEEPLTHLVFISGYDFRQHLTRRSTEAIAAVRAVADERSLDLIVVDTDLRSHAVTREDWKYGHGTALFAIAHSLRGVLGTCVVSATGWGRTQAPWGTHPTLDPLWSTESVVLMHAGAETPRWEKLRLVAAHPLAQKYLRVCTNAAAESYNCGYCGKCTMTRVALGAAGALHAMETLPTEVGRRDVMRIRANSPLNQGLLAESLRAFEASGDHRMAALIRRQLAPSTLDRLTRRVRRLPSHLASRLARARRRR